MPFQKGNKLSVGKGRGYELDEQGKQKLRNLLKRGLILGEKMAKGEASIKEQLAYGNIEKLVLKILDKFVPSKLHEEHTGEIDISETVSLDAKTQLLLKDFITWRKEKV